MKKYLKALVLLLCVCLCWAGVAMGEAVEIGDAYVFSTTLSSTDCNGKTIKLMNDISCMSVTVAENVNVTIDLNGHKLSSSGSSSATIYVNNGTTVTFTGGTVETNIQIFSEGTMVCGNNVTFSGEIDNKGTLRVDTGNSATFSGKVTNQNLINVAEDATATFNGEVTNKYHLIRGTYNSTVYNSGSIGGGATFNGKVTLEKTNATQWLMTNGSDSPRSVYNGGVVIPSKAELDAIYEGACVTVKFYDGTTEVGSMKWLPGVKTMPQENTLTASKEGATFLGWYTASGQQVTFAARKDNSGLVDYTVPVGLTEDTNVYATYGYTLTLYQEDGTFSSKDGWEFSDETGARMEKTFTFTNGETITINESDLPTLTRDDREFAGWVDEFGNKCTFPLILDEDLTLYPAWKYTVTLGEYDKTYGTAHLSLKIDSSNPADQMTTITAAEGTKVYLHAKPNDHYSIAGSGATASNDSVTIQSEGTDDLFSFTIGTQDVTVTPNFEVTKYAVTFNAYPGKFADGNFGDNSKWKKLDDNRAYKYIPYGERITAPNFAVPPTIENEPWYVPEWRKSGESSAFNFETGTVDGATTLTAAWKFTVAFDANGGSGPMDSVTVYRDDLATGEGYTLPECTFTAPEGKVFKGWRYKLDDSTTECKPGDLLTINEKMFTGDTMTLYAVWADVRTLTINCQAYRGEEQQTGVAGGSVKVYTGVDAEGNPTGELPAPYTGIAGDSLFLVLQPNTGYTFRDCELIEKSEGTLTEKDDETNRYYEYTFADSDATLSANFALKQHNVIFHANGGKIAGSNDETTMVQVYHGETVAKPDDPTSDKYTFTSWHKEISYGNLESTGFAFDTRTITEDTIIRAKWCATVKFDPNCEANEVTGEMNDIIFEELPSWLTKECTYKREGYKFIGWCFAKTPDDDKLLYKVGEFVPVGRNVTLYAQWEQQQTVQANAYLYKGTDRDEAVTDVLDFYSDEACTAKITGDVTGYSGDKIYLKINLDTDTEAKVDASYIEVLFNGGVIEANNGVYAITLDEYKAEGTTVVVKLPLNLYTVKVRGTGEEEVYMRYHGEKLFENSETGVLVLNDTIKKPKDNAAFAGLYEKDSSDNYSSTAFDYENTPVTRDMTLYARYKYTIKYNPAYVGSAFGDETPQTQTIYWDEVSGTNTVKLAKSTFTDPEGKRRVVGWRTENDTSAQKVFDDEQAVGVNDLKDKTGDFDSEINLYAVWVEERTVTVKTSGGYTDVSAKIYTDAECSGEGTTSYTGIAGDSIYLKADAGEGSTFEGWEKTGEGTLHPLEKENVVLPFVLGAGDAEITAKFNSLQYTVTFDGNGGKVAHPDEDRANSFEKTVDYGATVSSITAKRDNLTFKGWYEKKENGTWADEAFNFSTLIKQNYTLYARWEVTVTFDPNGGTGSMEPQTAEPNKPTALQKNTFTKEGYRFAGWFDAAQLPDNREPILDQEKVSYSSNVTLYAQWEEERTITAQVASEFANQEGFGVQIYKDYEYKGASAASVKAIEGETLYLKATMPNGYKVKQNGWSQGASDPGTISPNGYEYQAKFTVGKGNATITADFELKKYNYTFDAIHGKFANDETELTGSVEHGSTITPPTEIPTYSDETGEYTFADWYYSDKNGTAKEPFDFAGTSITESQDWNFIAKWNATVTYDANGANNFTGATRTALLDSEITLLTPATTPTRSANASNPYQHYQFNGWNTAQDGSGTHYDVGAEIESLNSNMTLYAEWKNVWGVQVRIDSANTDYIENVEIYKNYSDGVCSQLLDTATSEKYGSYVGCVARDKLYLKVTLKEGVECRNIKLETESSGTLIGVPMGSGVFRIDFEENHINIVVKTELQKYMVKFDADGGNLPSYDDNRQVVSHGKTAYKPSEPTRSGMVFMGWFEKDENGAFFPEEFDFNTPITKGYFLYAKWGYTVTYKPGYESSGQDDVVDKVEASKSYTLRGADTFTRNGYDLKRWESGGEEASFNSTFVISSNVVCTAQWELKKYDLIFDANGGYIENTNKPTEVTEKVPFGSNIDNYFGNGSSSKPSAERTGYYFTGWYEKENGELKDNAFNFDTTMPANDVHLYAKWEKLYTVTLHRHQDEDDTGTLKMGEYCKGAEVTVPGRPDGEWKWENAGLMLPGSATAFVGWNTERNGTGTAYDANDKFTMPGEDVNLYAQWRSSEGQQGVTVTYYANAGDTQKHEATELDNASTHTLLAFEETELTKVTGKKFVGWRVDDATTGTLYQAGDKINLLSTDIKVYAQWGDCTVTVKCDPEGAGTATHVRSDNTVTLSHNAADGYVFDKWTVEPNITISENSFTMPDDDVTVTAHFAKLHTVIFNAGEGHFDIEGNPATVTVQVKDNTSVGDAWPAVPVREHRTFDGWDNDGTEFKKDALVTSDMTLGALWQRDKHTVTLDYNGGKEDGKEDTGTTITDIECETTLNYNNKTLPTVKRDGFTFYAWYIMEDGNRTERRLATDVEIKDDITAKARWMYTVKFAAGAENVSGTQADATGYDDVPVTIPECTYEREGYDFIVWWDTSGKGYGAGERFSSLTGNVTLTAGWKIQQRKVTFDANGGTFKPEGQEETSIFETSVEYGGTPMPSLLAQLNSIICREGHEFKGWYTDQACTVAFDAEKAEIKTDITLYAKWELIQYNVTFDAGNGWWGDETETHAQTAKAAYGTTATAPADPVQTSGSGLDLRKYSFDGWFTQAEGGDPMSSVTIDKDTTFYAHWTTLYRVTVEDIAGNNHPKIHLKADHSDKGESEVWKPVGTTLYLDANPGAGYRLDQWPLIVVNGTYTVEADNVTILATYVRQVKVTFDATMGGTFPAGTGVSDDGRYLEKYVDENSSITPPSPEPQRGFDLLDGWLYDGGAAGDNTMPFDFDTMVISQDTMLYAQWKPGVGVVLDANGGTLAEGTVSPQRVPKGGKATKPADPSKDGCIFLGWYLEDAETPFDFEAALTQSVALYAHWKAEDKPTPTPEPEPTVTLGIIKQPTNATAQEGGKAAFTVEAQGDGLTYQWFVDRGDGQGFVPCTGATGATHTTTQLKRENNGYRYYCQVTAKDGTLRTDTVTLTVEATIPKTGDSANLALWLTLTAMSCAGMLVMLRRKRQTK